jgi:cytochrome c556
MQIYSFNLGTLGAMAKGKIPYDAKVAQNSADNLNAAVHMKNGAMWPKGSGTDALGSRTRAKPEAWSQYPKVAEQSKALKVAAAKMAAAAGNGLDGVKANMKDIGQSGKGCHKIARGPKN